MMPNVPLHSMVESNWIVPRDENLESSLFLLEQQEKEYNASLSAVAKIAAPEPIGTQRHSALSSSHLAGVTSSMGINMNMGMNMNMTMDSHSSSHHGYGHGNGMMRRVAPPSTASRRRRRAARGTAAERLSSSVSESVRRAGGDQGSSASPSTRVESSGSTGDGMSSLPMPTSPITPPRRTDSGIAGTRSYESSEGIQSNPSLGTHTHMDA